MKAAKAGGVRLFVSPHYYYPTDHAWQFGGTVEKMMHEIQRYLQKVCKQSGGVPSL